MARFVANQHIQTSGLSIMVIMAYDAYKAYMVTDSTVTPIPGAQDGAQDIISDQAGVLSSEPVGSASDGTRRHLLCGARPRRSCCK